MHKIFLLYCFSFMLHLQSRYTILVLLKKNEVLHQSDSIPNSSPYVCDVDGDILFSLVWDSLGTIHVHFLTELYTLLFLHKSTSPHYSLSYYLFTVNTYILHVRYLLFVHFVTLKIILPTSLIFNWLLFIFPVPSNTILCLFYHHAMAAFPWTASFISPFKGQHCAPSFVNLFVLKTKYA